MTQLDGDGWVAGDAYEAYMGRWSRKVAARFIDWLAPKPAAHWLEFGCGTGALTSTICARCEPASIVACDPSAPFVEHARGALADARASFVAAGADDLPRRDGGFDVVTSGLVLNFLPDPAAALASVRERLRDGGTFAAYVWDYDGGIAFLREFWAAAVALDPNAAALDEARRFPLCAPAPLQSLLTTAGWADVTTAALDITTGFADFDDFWSPFVRGTGPAPAYVAALDPPRRAALRQRLHDRLVHDPGAPIELTARAWAVRGTAG